MDEEDPRLRNTSPHPASSGSLQPFNGDEHPENDPSAFNSKEAESSFGGNSSADNVNDSGEGDEKRGTKRKPRADMTSEEKRLDNKQRKQAKKTRQREKGGERGRNSTQSCRREVQSNISEWGFV